MLEPPQLNFYSVLPSSPNAFQDFAKIPYAIDGFIAIAAIIDAFLIRVVQPIALVMVVRIEACSYIQRQSGCCQKDQAEDPFR